MFENFSIDQASLDYAAARWMNWADDEYEGSKTALLIYDIRCWGIGVKFRARSPFEFSIQVGPVEFWFDYYRPLREEEGDE